MEEEGQRWKKMGKEGNREKQIEKRAKRGKQGGGEKTKEDRCQFNGCLFSITREDMRRFNGG